MLILHKMHLKSYAAKLRGQLEKYISEVGVVNFFLLFLLAFITFFPLFFVGFTTNDDFKIGTSYGSTGNLIEGAKASAATQGRFTFFWGYPLLRVPYLLDSQVWYMATKIGALFIVLAALYFATRQIFRSTWIALASILFFLAFVQNGWDHNGLTSYPFSFNIYVALFLMSLGLFSAAIDKEKVSLAILSGVFYFFALGIELFVLFYPFYLAVLLLSRVVPGKSIARRLASGKTYLLSITLPLVIYLVMYILWRNAHPSGYDGNSLNGFNLMAAAKVVGAYSLSALPLASLHFMVSSEQQLLIAHAAGWPVIVSELGIANFIKPAVSGFLFAILMTATHFSSPKQRVLAIGAVLAFLGIFIPNLLLGFIQRHQDWVAAGSYSYLYTYYSFISAVVFLALSAAYLKIKVSAWAWAPRAALLSIFIMVVVVLSFAVELRNKYVFFDQKLSHRKWQLMEEVIKSSTFNEIPNGSTVVAPTLSGHYRGIAVGTAYDWAMFTKYKTGKVVRFVDDKCIDGFPCYLLFFRQAIRADNQFVVFSKIKSIDFPASTELVVYAMPKMANSALTGTFATDSESPKLEINGVPLSNVGPRFFSSYWPQDTDNGLMQTVRITGNVNLFPNQITVSQYDVLMRSGQVEADLGHGFYGWETGHGLPSWAWSKGISQLQIINDGSKPIAVTVRFDVTSLEKMNLSILGGKVPSVSIGPGVYRPVEVDVLAQPGITPLALQSDRPPLQPGGGDLRFLSFAIRDLQVQNR